MTTALLDAAAPDDRLETGRLILRRHRPADAAALARLIDNWNVVRWLAVVPFPYDVGMARDWITRCEETWASGAERQFVIERSEDARAC